MSNQQDTLIEWFNIILRQVQAMMTKDASYKLLLKAWELSNNESINRNQGIAQLIYDGYLTDQAMAMHRLSILTAC